MKNETIPRWQDQITHTRDLGIQVTLSIALGLIAFIAFCILRPKWTKLYYARKKRSGAASRLPDLPKTMFGWIPVLYGISEAEVLASAGLDAYVVSHSWCRRQRASAGVRDEHAPLVESV
jgi:calcium permeable stress-gated cation channel